jgi:hypothetical protein
MKRAKRTKRKASVPVPVPDGVGRSHGESTVVVPVAPPRNPFAVHAHRRRAGAHGDSARTRRKAEKRALRKLLEE